MGDLRRPTGPVDSFWSPIQWFGTLGPSEVVRGGWSARWKDQGSHRVLVFRPRRERKSTLVG